VTVEDIQAKYTTVEKHGGQYIAVLKIGNQSFFVGNKTVKAHAQWYARMLAKALQVLIENETDGGKYESTSAEL
jgi:hypothetical protein